MAQHVLFITSMDKNGRPAILMQVRPAPLAADEKWPAGGQITFWGGPLNEGEHYTAAAGRLIRAAWGVEFEWRDSFPLGSKADGNSYILFGASLNELRDAGLRADNIKQGAALFLTYEELKALHAAGLIFGVTMDIIEELRLFLF